MMKCLKNLKNLFTKKRSKKLLYTILLLSVGYLLFRYIMNNKSIMEGITNKNKKHSKKKEPVPQYSAAGKKGNDVILKAAEMEAQAKENTRKQ